MEIDIKIPKTFKRYTPKLIKKLTDIGYFDDVDEIKNKSHMIGNDVAEEFIISTAVVTNPAATPSLPASFGSSSSAFN